MKTFNVVTIFPDMVGALLKRGVVGKAAEKGLIAVKAVNLRDYAEGRHLITDDYGYGGGAGLVMKPEPLCKAVDAIRAEGETFVVLLDPRGKTFTQKDAEKFAEKDSVTFICGRYEGVDERVRELCADEEYSLGDFILTGGELAASVMIDATARLVEGVLGDEDSAKEESFTTGMLEYPHYTRPAEYRGLKVPEVLINGNHAEILKWRAEKALEITRKKRPEMLDVSRLDMQSRKALCEANKLGKGKSLKLNVALMHYPMRDKQGDLVTTAVTNLDLHDISRSCRTYGAESFFVVTPVKAQREIAARVIRHWTDGFGLTYNPNRSDAFSRTHLKECLLEAVEEIEKRHKKRPVIVATTARPDKGTITAANLGVVAEEDPVLVLFGTGWGFADDIFDLADYVLESIEGASDFNHLSVRSAVAILLDRITVGRKSSGDVKVK